ncbi:MAG: atpB [Chloroflexi bacterium]|nr:atpB [Chloroflexota bacterium]
MEIHVPAIQPDEIFRLGPLAVTNTVLTSWIALFVVIAFAVAATRNMRLVPSGLQNLGELIVEVLLGLAVQVAGSRARQFLPLVATLFLYILFANWIGIVPGVGSWNAQLPWQEGGHIVFRAPNSDLSLTAAMAIIVFFSVQIVGIRTNVKAYFVKFLWPPLIGQLEIIAEFSRPLSLALRLFGNILAGFILVEIMLQLVPPLLPVVFLGLELGVGLIQALIFAILTLAFLSLASSHGHSEASPEHSGH